MKSLADKYQELFLAHEPESKAKMTSARSSRKYSKVLDTVTGQPQPITWEDIESHLSGERRKHMPQTLTISDTLYARLEQIARERGFQTIEQLLEAWQMSEDERQQRQQIIQRIDQVREQLLATYGAIPDSLDLLREDRFR